MDEDSSIREIKGIGEKTEALFQKLGVNTAGDLLRFYPRAYDIYVPMPGRRSGGLPRTRVSLRSIRPG